MSNHLHDGHRQRMRERIMNGDMERLQPHEVLEYLLFSFIPRKDTNALAHELIKKFGSFNGVLNSDPLRLAEVSGMTQNAALFLSSLPAVFRRFLSCKNTVGEEIGDRGFVREYLRDLCWGLTEERVFAVALDASDKIILHREFDRGTGNSVSVNMRKIVDFAIANKACTLFIAHNHPSGNVEPSFNDIAVTKDLHYTLENVDVVLRDHYIFCDEKYYSFDDHGLMKTVDEHTKNFKEGVWKKSEQQYSED